MILEQHVGQRCGCACFVCVFTLGCLAWCCACRFSVSAAFRANFEQLVGLKCSIVQCMVQHDGIYLVILTMTSFMVEQKRVWNGFESMFRVSGIWDQPRMTRPPIGNGARSTTSKCTGPGKARAAQTRTVLQPVSYATFYTWYYRDWVTRGYQRLGRPHPSIARPVFASGAPDLMYAGMTSSSASSNSLES